MMSRCIFSFSTLQSLRSKQKGQFRREFSV
jgi:hypothetical protein